MMIKVGDEYLDFNEDIIVDRQIFNYATLETSGTFSYSFTITDTSDNRKKLGILDISSNSNLSLVGDVKLVSNSGNTIYAGYLIIDNPLGIDCSFFSDNNNFISAIEGKCVDLDLSQYDVLLSEDNIVNSWTQDTGIVFPLCDRGGLSEGGTLLRKDAFMKLDIYRGRLDYNDWQPFIFIKHAIDAMMLQSGLKITGELINEPTYQNLITTNNNITLKKGIIEKQNTSVATETLQTIPNNVANRVKVNFELSTILPQFNSPLNNWDLTLNRWTATYDCRLRFHFHFVVSDASKEIHWGIRRDTGPSTGVQFFTRSTTVDFYFDSHTTEAHAEIGDWFELWAYVDAGTPGTVDIIEGTWITEMLDTNMCFASALLPNIKNKELLSDIFKIFNVVADYDPFTKTINTTLNRNIIQKEAQDLSDYIHGIQTFNNFDLLSDYSQNNNLLYSESNSDDISSYNKSNEVPFGGGQIQIDNMALKIDSELFTLNFNAPFSYKNEAFGLYLIKLNYAIYRGGQTDDYTIAITSVTDGSPLAVFNHSGGPTSFYNNNFIDDAQGSKHAVGFEDIETTDQVIAIYTKNITLPNSFRFTQGATGGIVPLDQNIQSLFDMTNPIYNGHWEESTYASQVRTNASVAIFAKSQDGSPLDLVRQGLSFGPIEGFNTLTLMESYYNNTIKSLNDPVKPLIDFILPESVFKNLDFTKPVRLKTDRFNLLFTINKCTGYVDSKTPCTLELIKLSV